MPAGHERFAFFTLIIDDVTAVTCSISAVPSTPMRQSFYARGQVAVSADSFHANQARIVSGRAMIQIYATEPAAPLPSFAERDRVNFAIGSFQVAANFLPKLQKDEFAGDYEVDPVQAWVQLNYQQFDAVLSTLSANDRRGYRPTAKLQLAGSSLPGDSLLFAEIGDFVIDVDRTYPIVGFEVSAVYRDTDG